MRSGPRAVRRAGQRRLAVEHLLGRVREGVAGRLDQAQVDATLDAYLPVFSEIVALDANVARASVRLIGKVAARLPTVDSLIAASAQSRGACLVHRDGHFRAIPADRLPTIDLAPGTVMDG